MKTNMAKTIRIGWGWNVALLYTFFVAMIITLVVSSSRQKIDLVSKDYYKDELLYQQVLDAGKNQAQLQGSVVIHAGEDSVFIEFPNEFKTRVLTGDVRFYAAVNKEWDYACKVHTGENRIAIHRQLLHKTPYTIKVSYSVDEKPYYYESNLDLNH